jgi:hypothetical protein
MCDSFKINTCANNAGVGNKLVAIFYLPGLFYCNPMFSLFCQYLHAGSGQILQRNKLSFAGTLKKLRHTRLATGTIFQLKFRDVNG